MFSEEELDIIKQLSEKAERKLVLMEEAEKELEKKLINAPVFFERRVLGKILILNRRSATKFKYDKPWACISISDPGGDMPHNKLPISEENRIDLLRLEFDDIDLPRPNMQQISDEQANEIVSFVRKNWDSVDLLMIHCNAGVSRSTAVGKAMSEELQPEFSKFFDKLYSPNILVHGIMKKAQNE